MTIRKSVIAFAIATLAAGTAGCTSAADTANENLSQAAENFMTMADRWQYAKPKPTPGKVWIVRVSVTAVPRG